jgi:inhibitor of cysteine peptidase
MLTMSKSSCANAVAVALIIFLLAPAAVVPTRAQTSLQPSQVVSLSPGASTTIVLSENPSTGYKWRVDTAQSSNLAIVRVTDGGYQAAQTGLIGAPGSHRWQITARAPGTAKIVFGYARSWEHGAPAQTYMAEIDVIPAP